MQEADHILIPLLDGSHALAQVAREHDKWVLIHLTDTRATAKSTVTRIPAEDVKATILVDRAPLTAGQWPIIGYDAQPFGITTQREDLQRDDPLDPAIVEAFANALVGLFPWDGFPDAAYFDQFLRHGLTRPDAARVKADFPQPDPEG
ncbi:MAG: hypothetical protein AAGL89_07420 [Pseudomonadota bacterium]